MLKRLTNFEIVLLILSIYVVLELYLETVFDYSPQLARIVIIVDTVICAVFLYDFFSRYVKAEKKWEFIRINWIDFVSSIPYFGILRIGRLARIIRILRIVRTAKFLFRIINRKSASSTFKNLLIIYVILLILLSFSFYHFEHLENVHINSIWDSIWWNTITSLSLGFLQDIAPISLQGKILSVVLIIMGMVLFGAMISLFTDYFISEEKIESDVNKLTEKVDDMNAKIERIEKMLAEKADHPGPE